jgi:AraC family transcriptional regulator of adaptative response / DNA-3-methyladenine glycosylase II
VAQVRRVFDLNADVAVIGEHLANDPLLAPLVAKWPGLRAPGAWDNFELAVRAVLGQQITVSAARRLAGKLVTLCGATTAHGDLTHRFPDPAMVAAARLDQIGMPAARRATLLALAQAAAADPLLFEADAIQRLRKIPGVGAWTAEYIAIRALRDPDAFPATDVALVRGLAALTATKPTAAALSQRAEQWRPWRAYAAQYLWAASSKEKPQ